MPEYEFLDRQTFLAECEQLIQFLEGKYGYEGTGEPRHIQASRANGMIREYFDSVPILPLSRCPFCGQVNTFSIDTVGLDGLWWTFSSRRPGLEQYNLCPHFLNLLGAVKLHYPVPNSSLQIRPGPEVPFVVPKLIKHEAVKAVVSQINIGDNIAYPIFYYSEVRPILKWDYSDAADDSFCIVRFPESSERERLKMPIMWGQNSYQWLDEDGEFQISGGYLFDEDCDFELVPWIQANKLLWVRPGDELLTLHNSLDDCPYLNLPGQRNVQRIQRGKVWW